MTMLARMPTRIDQSWRMDGCGVRCRITVSTFPGRRYPERLAVHDPLHHEAYGQHVLAIGYGLLPRTSTRTGELLIDTERAVVSVAGREIAVTPIELGMLAYLAAHLGQLCTQTDVLRAVWGENYVPQAAPMIGGKTRNAEFHLLRVNLARLRAKLGPAGRLIETRRAVGYVLVSEPAA